MALALGKIWMSREAGYVSYDVNLNEPSIRKDVGVATGCVYDKNIK